MNKFMDLNFELRSFSPLPICSSSYLDSVKDTRTGKEPCATKDFLLTSFFAILLTARRKIYDLYRYLTYSTRH